MAPFIPGTLRKCADAHTPACSPQLLAQPKKKRSVVACAANLAIPTRGNRLQPVTPCNTCNTCNQISADLVGLRGAPFTKTSNRLETEKQKRLTQPDACTLWVHDGSFVSKLIFQFFLGAHASCVSKLSQVIRYLYYGTTSVVLLVSAVYVSVIAM
jgi:hypothetical protein